MVFADYAAVLAENLFCAYGIDASSVQLRVEIGPLELGVDKAIPAGLILNELISNALKHAFPKGRNGSVLVQGKLENGMVRLSVQDDGVGLGDSIAGTVGPMRKSLGMNIIKVLCGQLKATFEHPQGLGNGSIFRFSFPLETFSRAAAVI